MGDQIDRELAGIAGRQFGILTASDLRAQGMTRGQREVRVRSGRWIVLHDSVYRVAGAPATWQGDLFAACDAGGSTALASHRSAAALWLLPGGRTDAVELTCARWKRTRRGGLIVHETSLSTAEDRARVDGIPCTTVERTLFDLCSVVGSVTIDLAFDAALSRGLTNVERLAATAARVATKGRKGSRRFRAAVSERSSIASTPESAPERLVAIALAKHGLPKPDFQHEIRDATGVFVARVDLAYPAHRIAIEYDSFQEHTGKVALIRDSARRNAVAAMGWIPLSATAEDLQDGCERLATAIRAAMSRAAGGGVSSTALRR